MILKIASVSALDLLFRVDGLWVEFLGYGFWEYAFGFPVWGVRLRGEEIPVQGFEGEGLEGQTCRVSGVGGEDSFWGV